jgi:hypothetical protein
MRADQGRRVVLGIQAVTLSRQAAIPALRFLRLGIEDRKPRPISDNSASIARGAHGHGLRFPPKVESPSAPPHYPSAGR